MSNHVARDRVIDSLEPIHERELAELERDGWALARWHTVRSRRGVTFERYRFEPASVHSRSDRDENRHR
jgi:hypothetical protein